MYRYPIALTQQFRYCGNPFRVDMYKGCDFGCSYCFANSRKGGYNSNPDISDINIIKKLFIKAFESDKEYKDLTTELLRHRVPLHLGGLSDPFQNREWVNRLTYEFLKISNKYNYPVIISTKCANLPKEYLDILNPDIHAFQISLMGYNEEFVRKYEKNTPSPNERINFIKLLSDSKFWVSLRIQPLIDIDEALLLVKEIKDYIKYITIEHLKIPVDNNEIKDIFRHLLNVNYYKPKQGRAFELLHDMKIENIQKIKQITNLPIGVGDNDLHELSSSRCCCGIDCINSNFSNWFKYNYTYLITGKPEKDLWYPKGNVRSCINNTDRISKDMNTVKDYVDYYCDKFQYSILKGKLKYWGWEKE